MRRTSSLLFVVACVVATLPPPAAAWESEADWTASVPFVGTYGRGNARVHYDSEHRDIFQDNLTATGISALWNAEYDIYVPTLAEPTWYTSPTLVLSGEPYSLIPADFTAAQRLRERSLVPSMFAELPDFSYSMWDWMTGNEQCAPGPIPSVTGDACYEFGGWMGSLNSTHFVPQASWNYLQYHDLAVDLAGQCADYHGAMSYSATSAGPIPTHLIKVLDCGRDGLCPGDEGYSSPDDGELDGIDDFLEQCMVQALMFESLSHHFLQDSWSTGHMWHRWGGPDTVDFANNLRVGLAVAMTSGFIHGSRSVTHLDDRMCSTAQWRYAWGATLGTPLPAGHPVYSNVGFPYGVYNGVGDLFLGNLAGTQNTMFDECSQVSICETYAAGAPVWGAAPGSCAGSVISNSGDSRCHDQRTTNQSVWNGSGLDMGILGTRPLNGSFIYGVVKAKSGVNGTALACPPSAATTEKACLSAELARLHTGFNLAAIVDPNGISAATNTGPLAVGSYMGIGANESFASFTPSYFDSFEAPWDGDIPREEWLLQALHRGNAQYWCENLTHDDIYTLRNRCQNTTLSSDEQETACSLCEEFAPRQLRIGCSPDEYTDDRQPLCATIADPDEVDFVYLNRSPDITMTQDLSDAASDFCRTEWDLFSLNPIGPCLDVIVLGGYEMGWCTSMYLPFYGYQCYGCSGACPGWGFAASGLETQWEYADLAEHYWTSPDGSLLIVDDEESYSDLLLTVPLLPPWCGLTATGIGEAEFTACDPYYNCNTMGGVDLWNCYGPW